MLAVVVSGHGNADDGGVLEGWDCFFLASTICNPQYYFVNWFH